MKLVLEIEACSKELIQHELKNLISKMDTVTKTVTGGCDQEHLQLTYRIEPDPK